MVNIKIWDILEKKSQNELEKLKYEYKKATDSQGKILSYLDKLENLHNDYQKQANLITSAKHITKDSELVRSTINQLIQLKSKAKYELSLTENIISNIINHINSKQFEINNFKKMSKNLQKVITGISEKKLQKENEILNTTKHNLKNYIIDNKEI